MATSYDEKQYESYSYSLTFPAHLQAVGSLFGLQPTAYENAKVLELGSASGGNIIPLAVNYPKSKIVGIDLSAKQIEKGQAMIQQLGLSNIELKHQSIEDFTSDETFDYIICHGVYAWVPEKIRDKILEIVKNNLHPEGIACISYNTRPCWNMVSCVRDMMKFHVRNFGKADEQVVQARALLNFLASGLEKENSPYARFIKDELGIVSKSEDYYIYHEYLEEENNPIYFHEFVKQASEYQLTYLGDSHIPSMYPGNLKESFSKKLIEIQDVVRVGQYMDFIRNQRFRTTLICHPNQKINRNLSMDDITRYCLSYSGKFQKSLPLDRIKSNEAMSFEGRGVVLTVQKPLVKACMKILHDRFGKPLSYDKLLKQSMELVSLQDEEEAKRILNQELNLMRLLLGGLIQIHVDEGIYTNIISATPKTTPYIQKQAKQHKKVSNLRHETHNLQDIERIILQFADGKHKIDKMNQKLEEKIISKELNLQDEKGNPVTKKQDIAQRVKKITLSTLENLVRKAYILS